MFVYINLIYNQEFTPIFIVLFVKFYQSDNCFMFCISELIIQNKRNDMHNILLN